MDTSSPAPARELCLRALPKLRLAVGAHDPHAVRAGDTQDAPVLREIGDGMVVEYTIDDAGGHVRLRDLAAAGISADELHADAIANLASVVDERCEVHEYGAIHAVLLGGNLEASLILMDEFWTDWVGQFAPTAFVAAFPAQDVLAFGDAASADAIRELHDLCTRVDPAVDQPLTSLLYTRTDTGWVPLADQD